MISTLERPTSLLPPASALMREGKHHEKIPVHSDARAYRRTRDRSSGGDCFGEFVNLSGATHNRSDM